MRRRMLGLIRRISGLGLDAKAIMRLLESTPNPVGVAIEERIAFANGASSRLLGARREDIVGRSVFDLVHPDDRESTRSALAKAQAERDVAPLQVRLIALDGTTLDVEARLAAIHFRGRDAVLFYGRDRSDRRRSEAALRESEARYRLLAESSYDVVSEYTAAGQLLYVSPSIERVLGYTPEEWQREHAGRAVDVLHPDDIARGSYSRAERCPRRSTSCSASGTATARTAGCRRAAGASSSRAASAASS